MNSEFCRVSSSVFDFHILKPLLTCIVVCTHASPELGKGGSRQAPDQTKECLCVPAVDLCVLFCACLLVNEKTCECQFNFNIHLLED